jgi:hypothetical protein
LRRTNAGVGCGLMADICPSILEAATEPRHERPNQGITECVARDIDGRPIIGGDEDRID